MRITVKFHGLLGKLCPGEHTVEANNAYEALRIVCKNNEKKLTRKNGHRFDCFCKQARTVDDLYKRGGPNRLDVLPSFAPSGGGSAGNFWKMIAIIAIICVIAFAGVALVGAIVPSLTVGGAIAASAPYIGQFALYASIGALCSTIAQHLQKDKKPDQNETQQNYAFGMNGNTTKVGTAIPIGYGRYRVYGQLLSWGTSTTDPVWVRKSTDKTRFGLFRSNRDKMVLSGMTGPQIQEGTVNQW